MPNFNIHWKGYPHHHLPQIRVLSIRGNSVQSRGLPISGQTLPPQSHTKNEKESKRRPFKIQFRRQRMRNSRASSALRARRRASVRARHHIQVFGWDTPGAELASRVTEKTGSGDRTTNHRSISIANLQPAPQDDSAIPSTDGATSSVTRRVKPERKKFENTYSLKHITKVPVYWTAKHPLTADKAYNKPNRSNSAQRLRPLQTVSNQIPSRRSSEKSRPYDTRITLSDPSASGQRRLSSCSQFKRKPLRQPTSQVSPKRKDTGVGPGDFWEAVRSHNQQSMFRGRSTASTNSVAPSFLAESASRSPRQKRVLARFTKGIELYLQAAKEYPSPSLISSFSTHSMTSLSAHTIQELKPYQSEFRSAGLAVTSAEQKGMAELQKAQIPPLTPPKDDKFMKRKSRSMKNSSKQKSTEKAKLPSYASGSTGTTVLGWTPPHEKTYRWQTAKDERKSTASMDQTVVGSSPPHEIHKSPPQPTREAPTPLRASVKKSLPWLRKPDPSPESSTTKNSSGASTIHEQHRSSTPLGGWVSTAYVQESNDKEKEHLSGDKSPPVIPQRPTKPSRDDLQYTARKSTATNYMNQVIDEMTRSDMETFHDMESSRPNHAYLDTGTQTVDLSPKPSRQDIAKDKQAEGELDADNARSSSSRGQTFAVKSNNCHGDCNEPSFDHQSLLHLCAQCAGPLIPHPEDESVQKLESKLKCPVHACTAKSSVQCQQCFPSRNSSLAMSPLQVAFPAEVQYLPSRRSTRPIIPTGPFEYPQESLNPPREFESTLVHASKSQQTPESKPTQGKAEKDLSVDTLKSHRPACAKRPQSLAQLAIEEYTRHEPVADPMKRPCLPRLKVRPATSDNPKHIHCYSTMSCPKKTPRMPIAPAVDTTAYPDKVSTSSNDSCSLKSGEVKEKQVFKGLHVATAAACDEDVDKWIEEITGSSARKFLSKLSAFDGLGVNTLAGVARRAAKQRRDKLKAWEAVRETRMAEQDQNQKCEIEDFVGMEYMLGDQGVGLDSICHQNTASADQDGEAVYMVHDQAVKKEREDLTSRMLNRRRCKESEDIKQRAVRMGWRERSVSEGG